MLKGSDYLNSIEKKVWDLSSDAVESEGCQLYLVEYVKEGKDRVLRLLIDSENGVDINQCENISRKVSDILDDVDPIPESYMLEVSSSGLERKLVLPWHFEKYMDCPVDVGLYAAVDGYKKFCGILKDYVEKESITIDIDDEKYIFELKNVSSVNLHFEF